MSSTFITCSASQETMPSKIPIEYPLPFHTTYYGRERAVALHHVLSVPFPIGKEGSDVGHNKSQPIQNCPCNNNPFKPGS
ncbi:hypothetical protein SDC9_183617 [bioreactor metagenome]|uniref:Uncharacterized protein n=1 Tax=bioreactor metagenome TaxID=1076179 RepID=A0A645HCL2_9ZZZZ